jgi:hypothetical protein
VSLRPKVPCIALLAALVAAGPARADDEYQHEEAPHATLAKVEVDKPQPADPPGYAPPPDAPVAADGHALDGDAHGLGTDVDEAARVKTHFLAGVGLLALPAADVCPFNATNCEPGETGLALSLRALGEIYDFMFGGGITFAFGLRSSEAVDPDGSLQREHSRSYFLVEGQFRYLLPPLSKWHWWVGASGGVAVINDAWTTIGDREPPADTAFVGPRAVTLSTEGGTVGISAGGHWMITDHWLFGTQVKYANWILPGERATTPVGDSASLAGRIDVLEVGLFGGFRIPL